MPRSTPRGLLRLVFLAVSSPLLFGAGPDYVGCGGPEAVPSGGRSLPEAAETCEVDEDCPADMCAEIRCLAGTCVQVAPMVDADGDGDAPPPCGGDCDDTRPEVGSGFGETCDGLDNDCNMLVDDGASRIDRVYPITNGDPTTVVVPWGDRFLLTDTTRVAIFGTVVTIGGEASRPFELQRLVRGAAFRTIAAAAASDGRVLFVTLTDDSLLRYLIAAPDGDGITILEGPEDLESGLVDIQAVDVIPFGDAWAIGIYGRNDAGAQRAVMTSVDAPPPIVLEVTPSGTLSFAIATDGTHLVVPDTDEGLHFFLPTGEEVVGFSIPGLSSARHPIASWRGAVVAVTADAFDYNIGFVDSFIGLGSVEPAPFGDPEDVLFVHTADDLVLVSRLSTTAGVDNAMRVQAIQSDLSTYEAEPLVLADPSMGIAVSSVSVAAADGAIGVGGGNETGAALGVLRACAGP